MYCWVLAKSSFVQLIVLTAQPHPYNHMSETRQQQGRVKKQGLHKSGVLQSAICLRREEILLILSKAQIVAVFI